MKQRKDFSNLEFKRTETISKSLTNNKVLIDGLNIETNPTYKKYPTEDFAAGFPP